MKLKMSVISGPDKDKTEEFSRSLFEQDFVIVGREDECTYQLNEDQHVSRYHFLLEINPPNIVMRDLGSRNGTEVNGNLYGGRKKDETPEEASARQIDIDIKNGDTVKIGKTEIRFEVKYPAKCKKCGQYSKDEEVVDEESFICKKCKMIEKKKEQIKTGTAPARPAPQKINADDKKEKMPEIPGYKTIKQIGKGGFGAVYLAIHKNTGLKMALKTMLQTQQSTKKQILLFEREIDTMGHLNHPNIVKLQDYGFKSGIHYFVMEFIESGSLMDIISGTNSIPIEQAKLIMLQTLEGLAYAHSRDIIHRDLKPSNILLAGKEGNWTAKISDYGLAKNFMESGMTKTGITNMGEFCGSPPYMAPEHIKRYKYVNPRTDVFEIAATFYHMLTGQTVWKKDGNILQSILKNEATPIRQVNKNIPAEISNVIDRALSRNENLRYKDGGAMLEALKKAI